MIIPTKKSLLVHRTVALEIDNLILHDFGHFLLDIAWSFPDDQHLNYLEIGCFAGASACLMLQRPNTSVVSVDIGEIISPKFILDNAKKLQQQNTTFDYIQGNSQDPAVSSKVRNLMPEVDIFYIDGDSNFSSITKDFQIYCDLVKVGGYIVFDDCLEKAPPYTSLFDIGNFETIGYISNSVQARPKDLKAALYVIKKIK